MKPMRAICLLLLCALLAGCGGGEAPETSAPPAATTATPSEAETEMAWVPETTAPAVEGAEEGFLFLTVSRLDFSLVGESEDIYIGTIPREEVVFESADPSVATFENGVLTATGVGSTTVVARYGNKYITCSVGCLAETEEDLTVEKLTEAVLRSPKRYPPVMGDAPMDYFTGSALVGDSISQILFQWETMYDYLGETVFLVRGGTGLNGIVRGYMPIFYKGQGTAVEEALLDAGCDKVFIMLGQNDLRYREIDECLESWEELLPRIREKNPGIQVHIQSVIPEWLPTFGSNENNEKIAAFNEKLKVFAEENGCAYVDISYYVVDHTGRMASSYELDQSIHMNYDGCYAWIQALKAYAWLQEQQ